MTRPSNRLLLGFLLVALTACGGGEDDAPPPNIVLVVLDTVRADHVSCYGYGRETTPHLDALAESATRYTSVRATGPWTLPSHASMFTGRFAFQHRADSLQNEEGQWRELPLKEEHTTLAEALGGIGYRTGGFAANTGYLRTEFQLDQGFDRYEVEREPGVVLNTRALAWLDESDGPFFLFLNYMDAHRPYNTQALPEGRLADVPCDGSVPSERLLDRLIGVVLRDGKPAPPKLQAQVTACYDLGIANADLAVGELVAELRRRGLYEDTLLIVTSDHGEYLGEHGLVEHSKDVYEPALHVPLVLKQPGGTAGAVDESLLSLADLPRLVAGGLPGPLRDELHAHFPLLLERDFTLAEISLSRERDMRSSYAARFRRQRQAYYADGHKLILSTDGQHELYDLAVDPDETMNLYETRAPLAQTLTAALEAYVAEHPAEFAAGEAPEFDAAAMQALIDLGYAGEEEGDGAERADDAEQRPAGPGKPNSE